MIRFLIFSLFFLTADSRINATEITLDSSRTVEVIGPIDTSIISDATKVLQLTQSKKDIWILVNSPGGMVDPGLIFINAIEIAKSRGIKVNCAVGVLAASMAFQILSHCNKVYSLPNAKLLFHPVSIQGRFTLRDMSYYVKEIRVIEKDMNNQLLSYFKFNKKLFYKHYYRETMWEAKFLAKQTDKITIVGDIKGTDNLFIYRRANNFFGQSLNLRDITYIMPGN